MNSAAHWVGQKEGLKADYWVDWSVYKKVALMDERTVALSVPYSAGRWAARKALVKVVELAAMMAVCSDDTKAAKWAVLRAASSVSLW